VSIRETDVRRRAEQLRHVMVTKLLAEGSLTTPAWQAAFEAVPRDLFVPVFYRQTPTSQRRIDASSPEEWLTAVYADELLLTRADASSSSTVPSLMAAMLEALDPNDGDRVLEIGTGSGYNAALLCHRFGSNQVTTLDIDRELVRQARERLADIGYRPTVVAGDGASGWPERAPYDRLIATCAVDIIPTSWLTQVRPGGQLVVPIATGIAVLTVHGPSAASGGFLPQAAYFMPLRGDTQPVDVEHVLATVAQSWPPARPTEIGLDVWSDNDFQFILALAIPGLRYLINEPTSGAAIFWHPDRSWAALLDGRVRQGGTRRVWENVETAFQEWNQRGKPEREQFSISITGPVQRVEFADAGLLWELPATR
jgi:protein-L-isoaspartate(D-aspartate) O-methyltransferase